MGVSEMRYGLRAGRTLVTSLLAAGTLIAAQGALFVDTAEARGGAKSAFARKYLSNHGYAGDFPGADTSGNGGEDIKTLDTVKVTATYRATASEYP